jgi:hypothetical protein
MSLAEWQERVRLFTAKGVETKCARQTSQRGERKTNYDNTFTAISPGIQAHTVAL